MTPAIKFSFKYLIPTSCWVGMVFLPLSFGQTQSASVSVLAAIKAWEQTRQITVSQDLRDKIVSRTASGDASTKTDTFITTLRAKSYPPSDRPGQADTQPTAAPQSLIESATFVYLDQAAKIQLGERKGDMKQIGTLESSAADKVNVDRVLSFLSSRDGYGFMVIDSSPRNAEIYIDNDFIAYTPNRIGLSAQLHRYRVVVAATAKTLCEDNIVIEADKTYPKTCK